MAKSSTDSLPRMSALRMVMVMGLVKRDAKSAISVSETLERYSSMSVVLNEMRRLVWVLRSPLYTLNAPAMPQTRGSFCWLTGKRHILSAAALSSLCKP